MVSKEKKGNINRQITLKDIAKQLGISTATVSLSINNNPLVAAKTREKVLAKIEEIGYVYNRRAASLITGESRMVGLAVHDITNPYFTEVCESIEKVLSQQGRMSLLCNSHESLKLQSRFIAALVEHNADGLILCPVAGSDLTALAPILKRGLPTVLVTRDIEGADMDFVGNDERLSMRLATEHLLALGHTKIAFVGGGIEAQAAFERRAGYIDAIESSAISDKTPLFFDCENNPVSGQEVVAEIINSANKPTAIVGFSDQVALGVISGLLEHGLKPGVDMAVVGCDNISESSRAYTQLTTINIHKSKIGQLAAEFLFNRLKDPQIPIQRKIFAPELIIRQTCGSKLV
ncbi:MAG: LacI family DNA-binding transcriptional regulator [Oceanospirillaceae bacterium]|nr:LacI family DNA-binding transcriptional regulator [Oceanospirillaceae bacterium]